MTPPIPPTPAPQTEISPERKFAFYFGTFLTALGFLTFVGSMLIGALTSGGPHISPGPPTGMIVGFFTGFFLIIAGGITASIGRSGLAGSGTVLDPQQARKDLEPYSRAAGGMISDALEEIPALQQHTHPLPPHPPKEIIKIRCAHCQSLNEDHARFCNQCAQPLQ